MDFVFMNGGLGNQTFQYIFLRYLELTQKRSVLIDDSPFFGKEVPFNGYELERVFGIQHDKLSEHFDSDVWDYMLSSRTGIAGVAQELLDGGLDLCMIYDADNYRFNGPRKSALDLFSFDLTKYEAFYFHGYWLRTAYYEDIKDVIDSELKFPSFLSGSSEEAILQKMDAQELPVCIHIRRGDLVELGLCQGMEYYYERIKMIRNKYSGASYYLFSDDLEWCIENQELLGLTDIFDELTIVDGHTGHDAWMDLALMKHCQIVLTDRSSFGLLAYILGKREGKEIISNFT